MLFKVYIFVGVFFGGLLVVVFFCVFNVGLLNLNVDDEKGDLLGRDGVVFFIFFVYVEINEDLNIGLYLVFEVVVELMNFNWVFRGEFGLVIVWDYFLLSIEFDY